MISRHWRGVAKTGEAANYIEHLKGDTFPKLSRTSGFIGASILSKVVDQGVEFLIITDWESIEAIKGFAGEEVEIAVVPPVVEAMMIDYEREVRHFEIVTRYP
jgi:heme-degrading monooxygenase HmoA